MAELLNDDLAFNRGIKALKRYSLVSTQTQSISIHRLVQAVVRDNLLEKNEHEKWIEQVVKTVNKLFPAGGYNDPGCWPECGALIFHAQVIAEAAYTYELAFEETTILLYNIASYLYGRAQYKEAEMYAYESLEFRKSKLDTDHRDVANSMSWLGFILNARGKYEEAEPLYRRALEIYETRLGKDHPSTIVVRENYRKLLNRM